MHRPGQRGRLQRRRGFQLACPRVLIGEPCRAKRISAREPPSHLPSKAAGTLGPRARRPLTTARSLRNMLCQFGFANRLTPSPPGSAARASGVGGGRRRAGDGAGVGRRAKSRYRGVRDCFGLRGEGYGGRAGGNPRARALRGGGGAWRPVGRRRTLASAKIGARARRERGAGREREYGLRGCDAVGVLLLPGQAGRGLIASPLLPDTYHKLKKKGTTALRSD